jgi:outer membrane receptor protein involved in Fe transport
MTWFRLLILATILAPATRAFAQTEPASPAPPDTTPRPRAVVRMSEFVVRGSRLHDPVSSQTVRIITTDVVRALPVDRAVDLLALQAGVVARGEELHVRGGRAGESRFFLQGISLGEPLRGKAAEVPILVLREAEIASGGFDADLGGALAGVIQFRTVDPGESWGGEGLWQTDGRLGTHFDRVSARAGGPLPRIPIGIVATMEATLDDTHLPALRSISRHRVLGGSFGWRADNRLLGHVKLATRGSGSRWTLDVLANRRVERPFDPMWSLDGWTSPCLDPKCALGPGYSPEPVEAYGWARYVAADHLVMTDDRKLFGALSWARLAPEASLRFTLGWLRARSITSLDGRDDQSYLAEDRAPVWGYYDWPYSDPFLVYAGDDPYFRKASSDAYTLRGDWQRTRKRGDFFKAGAGATYESVELREVDFSLLKTRADSIRTYRAFAPGGFAYAHARMVFEGMVANAGMRVEAFTAGPQAEDQAMGGPARVWWSASPRAGVAYPISVKDVLSLSYVRVSQNPDRDFLYDNRRREIANREPLGNPGIEPATLISYQLAFKHVFGASWSAQTAFYYRDLFGLVGARNARPRAAIPRLRYENADDAHASGLELTLYHDRGAAHAELQYGYLDARGSWSREEGVPFGPRLSARPESIGEHALDWDRRHTVTLAWWWSRPDLGSISWSTFVGSGLPWTPRARRQLDVDLSLENTRRFPWHESTALAARWRLPWRLRPLSLGVDVRNLFDNRWDEAVTVDGYPNPDINTFFDDYGAHRTETGLGGGAYYDDRTGDGQPGWIRVHDPRLEGAPRAVRARIDVTW